MTDTNAPTPSRSNWKMLLRRHRLPMTLAVALLASLAGVVVLASASANLSEQVEEEAAERRVAEKEARRLTQTNTRLEWDLVEAEEAAEAAEAASAELAAREAQVAAREQAVTATEQQIRDTSFGGGLYIVGRDVAAGTYRTGELTSSCYYAWMAGTGADADIVDNNIVSEGTATVTLRDGETFESSRCGTWTKIG